MKRNCYNCKCLTEEYEMGDTDGHTLVGGFHCDKQYQKAYEAGKEIEYENNMDREEYRKKGKVCFEAKTDNCQAK